MLASRMLIGARVVEAARGDGVRTAGHEVSSVAVSEKRVRELDTAGGRPSGRAA
jgi:hypothetical protein